MPLLAAAAVGGRRGLVDSWATAPSTFNLQEPLGQAPIPPWPEWSRDTKIMVLFASCLVGLVIFCCAIQRLFCRNKDDHLDTSRFVLSDNDDGESVSSPPPPLQEPQPPAVADMPAADVEMALGDVQLTQADVDWMLANLELPAPTADMDMAPAVDEEIAPAPEPRPTLKCTYSMADGWDEGTCSVCLSELVDGEKVRVLTACMHCFHATCIAKWLRRGSATCPLCSAPVMILPARGRRRRRRRTQA